jgi:hypothetical protein
MMITVVVLALRSMIGAIASTGLAVIGYFIAWSLWVPTTGRTGLTAILCIGIGVAAGLGASVAWLRPDAGRMANAMMSLSVIAAGILGAWIGFNWGSSLGLAETVAESRRFPTIFASVIAVNSMCLGTEAVRSARRLWR